MSNQYSPKSFIKGKIAELIFDQMFREGGKFTVLHFGYEGTLPEIAQHKKEVKFQQVLDNVKNAPDFVIVSSDRKEVYLVEVKYRSEYKEKDLIEIVKKIQSRWDYVWLFIVTQNGFYFDSCTNIKNAGGKINRLDFSWVSEELQDNYLSLLKEFIK